MKRKILITILAAFGLAAAAAVPASVSRAVRQVDAAPGLEVVCAINGSPASLTLAGECFILDLGGNTVYFDGTTQWSYSRADNEVTVIEPTPGEVAETNPLHILRALAVDYNGTPVKGQPNSVRLTPVNPQNEVAEATVTFDPQSGWPTAMTVITGSGRADITKIKFTPAKTKKPASAFKFKVPQGAIVSDFR